MLPILFFSIFAFANAQQWIDFKTLKGDSAVNTIVATGNVSIYLTATADASSDLNKIIFSAGGLNKTASEVMSAARLYIGNDLLQPWIVQGPVTVTTSATSKEVGALTGSIYITSAKQAYDTSFLVYDLKYEQTISPTNAQSTIVILNSQYLSPPYVSSSISSWKQTTSQSVYLYRGLPLDDAEHANTAIFSNPFSAAGKEAVVTSVEDFSLNLPIFYMRVYNGVSFKISTQYKNIAGNTFSNAITTGFYMRSQTGSEVDIQLHPLTAQSSNKLGVNFIGSLPTNGEVTIGIKVSDSVSWEQKFGGTVSQSLGWSTSVGNPLTIKSSGTIGGDFYLQYYVIPGDAITSAPNDNPTTKTTSRPISTTTQSSSNIQFALSIFCSILGYRIMQ